MLGGGRQRGDLEGEEEEPLPKEAPLLEEVPESDRDLLEAVAARPPSTVQIEVAATALMLEAAAAVVEAVLRSASQAAAAEGAARPT